LLEPDDIVPRQHLRGPQRPLVAVRPEGVAAAGIDHQLHTGADRLARRADEELVGVRVAAAERLPAELDRLEAAAGRLPQLLAKMIRLVEKERAVRLDPVPINTAEQAGD